MAKGERGDLGDAGALGLDSTAHGGIGRSPLDDGKVSSVLRT
ncbi:hypothetical protein [Bradyrhizobium sp. SRS-191]|nr:hypothetical protein [Bradyrhizobium sp. SRS-191]